MRSCRAGAGSTGRLLEAEGFLDSFLLLARAPDAVGHAQGPRALAPGRGPGEKVVEALHEPRRLYVAEGEAARGTARESPLRH